MKRTLIVFLLIFCVRYTNFATINNTTRYEFSVEEEQSLLSGQSVEKQSSWLGIETMRMKSLFPPRFTRSVDVVSLSVDRITQVSSRGFPARISWLYVLFGMILPPLMLVRRITSYRVLYLVGVTVLTMFVGNVMLGIGYVVYVTVFYFIGRGARQLWFQRKEKLAQA